jgi:hypothetical protein
MPIGPIPDSNDSITILHEDLGFIINNSGETLFLKNDYEVTVDTWNN